MMATIGHQDSLQFFWNGERSLLITFVLKVLFMIWRNMIFTSSGSFNFASCPCTYSYVNFIRYSTCMQKLKIAENLKFAYSYIHTHFFKSLSDKTV